MDSQGKQRITGAIILVALFVLLAPELLKGPQGAKAPEGAPTDEGMRRYTIDLDASVPPAPVDHPAAQPTVALPPVADGRAQPGEEATPAEVAPAPEVAAAPKPTTQAATPAPRVEPPKPAPATPAPTRPVPAAEKGTFVVQLGTFGSKENADKLVRDMTAKGFTAFLAPYTKDGRELYRVRVGPTRDRPAAEALAAQLKRMGQSGSVVPIS